MKKLILSLAALAMGAIASQATSYTIFDIADPGAWTGGAEGYTSTRTVDGAEFTLSSNKGASTTDLIAPDANSYAWRVYKNSDVIIESKSVDMKSIVITFDDYKSGSSTYYAEMTLSEGWRGSLEGVTYSLASDGLKTIKMTADRQQVRIKKIVVSDEVIDIPDTPENPDDPGEPVDPTPGDASGLTIFDIANPGTWTGDVNGYTSTVTVDGNEFVISSNKAGSTTDLIAPDANSYSWRVYKGSSVTIESKTMTMKTIVITFDDYKSGESTYYAEMTLSEGWTGVLNGYTYTVSGDGKSITLTADRQQVRIKKIVVSDKEGDTPTPPPTDPTSGLTIFDIANPGTWTGDVNGYTSTRNVDGYEFTISSEKAASTTDLIAPDANSYSWRVYKGSKVNIESKTLDMKTIVITFDDYKSGESTYNAEMTLSAGWEGTLDGCTYTLSSNGEKSISLAADAQQVRIKKIVVSGEGGGVTPPPTPPTNQIYANDFKSSIADWTVTNEIDNGLAGWKVNNKDPKCAIANSYNGGEGVNLPASSWLSRSFDFTDRENVELSFDQAFGYVAPQSQPDYATLNIREEGETEWEQLILANYPPKPEKTYTTFVNNTLDLSAYDGVKVEIAFHYTNDGEQSIVWELQNFVLTGDYTGEDSVKGIEAADEAPVYFNLQGQRVANAEKGLFIMVKGGKATKVIL